MYKLRGWEIERVDTQKLIISAKMQNNLLASANFIENTQEIKNPPLSLIIDFESTEYGCVTIVCNAIITATIKKLETLSQGKIEIFENRNLQINILDYFLQPTFYKLPDKESTEFKKSHFNKKFPIMAKTDPVARFLKFTTNDIIRITASDGYITFRIVK